MEYLTTHDLVWVNNIVTGKVQPYDYVTLEAVMAAQYSYGESQNVVEQAAKLLERMMGKAPFALGNRRMAFISTLTFLNANGYATYATDSEAVQTLKEMEQGLITPVQAIERIAAPASNNLPVGVTLRKLITHECNHHVEALRVLSPGD
jgi:death-on-curing family protein